MWGIWRLRSPSAMSLMNCVSLFPVNPRFRPVGTQPRSHRFRGGATPARSDDISPRDVLVSAVFPAVAGVSGAFAPRRPGRRYRQGSLADRFRGAAVRGQRRRRRFTMTTVTPATTRTTATIPTAIPATVEIPAAVPSG